MVDRSSPEFRSYVELYERASLLELGTLAHQARWRLHPDETVTYIIDRNINYTNVCVADCKFCAFAPSTAKATCSHSRRSGARSTS